MPIADDSIDIEWSMVAQFLFQRLAVNELHPHADLST